MKMTGIVFLLILSAITSCSNHSSGTRGIVYPADCYMHNGKGGAVMDITKPPYNADNTGREDCTTILIKAMDDITGADRALMKRTNEILENHPDSVFDASRLSFQQRQQILAHNPEAVVGFERQEGIFPYRNPPARILYFPNGIYKVSNTIVYSWEDLKNRPGKEMNRCIHIQGQSEKGTVIRLVDNAPGFGTDSSKAVLSFTRGNPSNISMQNSCENLTIEIGRDNPGATGMIFYANNTGVVRHVTIRSLDKDYRGRSGLAITTTNSSCALMQHITVEGFDYGIEIHGDRLYSVMEHINIKDQRKAGVLLADHNLSIRALNSENAVPAVSMEGEEATLALVDCRFEKGNHDYPAVNLGGGLLYARDITTEGYQGALMKKGKMVIKEPFIEEYISQEGPALDSSREQKSLNLPVEDPPNVAWEEDFSGWTSVNEQGAKADGLTDDTEAIQQAMDSGKPVVYFQRGIYLINKTITVPAHVHRINFMFCDLVAGGELQQEDSAGAFQIAGQSDEPLLMEDLFAFERYFGNHYLIDHASKRTLILRDMQTQVGAMYFNSVPGGKVFIENVASTDQFPPNRNCFSFTGQQVWARQLNPERADPEVINDGGKLWVLGFKTEKDGTAFLTVHGGKTEVLGGIFNISRSEDSSPMIVTRNAEVSVFASTTDHRPRPSEWNLRPFVADTENGITRTLSWNSFPKRDENLIVIPLYSNQEEN